MLAYHFLVLTKCNSQKINDLNH